MNRSHTLSRGPTLSMAESGAQAGNEDARDARAIGTWLMFCCLFLLVLIVVGGVTRLTHSGLSITEWQPLIGTLPPIGDAQWAETFAKYQQTPEYLKVNQGMSIEEFKGIFWWEYVHRLLARSLGLVFFVPLLWFAARGRVRGPLAWKLGGIFLLGGAQGAMGWYMVMSGLVDDTRVSHLRLTAHLGLAFTIFAAMFWLALDQLRRPGSAVTRVRAAAPTPASSYASARARPASSLGRANETRSAPAALAALAVGIALLVFLQALSGGMVAGVRAGFAYNTFPLMADHWIPPGIMMLEPWFMNAVNNVATIQFIHRVIGWLLLGAVGALWWKTRKVDLRDAQRTALGALALAMLLQFGLGVATLLAMVPIPLAAAHQAGAVVLFAAAINAAHALRSR